MEREADQKVKGDLREQVMDGLLESNPLDIPHALKHEEMHSMQHEAMQRMGIEDHDQAPPLENFQGSGRKACAPGSVVAPGDCRQEITVDEAMMRERVEEMCAGYENADDMVNMYMSNPQVMQQIEPMVVEQQAIDWIIENGKAKTKKVSFKDYMNAPAS